MVQMRDGLVVIFGKALEVEPAVKFVEDRKPGMPDIPDGYVVMIKAHGGGYARVKYGQAIIENPNNAMPQEGAQVCLLARPWAMGSDRGAGATFGYSFVRAVTGADLDQIIESSSLVFEPAEPEHAGK